MTGETLVAVATMRAKGPNSPARSSTPRDNLHERRAKPNNLSVQTDMLAPLAGPVSPVSQTSHDPAPDVSPISSSSSQFHSMPVQQPSPISGPPGPGTAISIAGSEARIVRIPPRPSKLSASSGGGPWRPDSQQTFASADLPPPLAINRNRPVPARLLTPVAAPVSTARDDGGYVAYHPSIAIVNSNKALAHSSRISHGSLGGLSTASSDVVSPDTMSWPMPPSTPTTSPDRH